MMTRHRLSIILPALVIALAALACQIDLGGPPEAELPARPAGEPITSLDQV